ncbi:glycosyltransferase [Verrucosispora sp. NA02020]|uniref:glycosyltransferase n=1 Tax=unclassified Micromonospora TaxID=2617518 RepID=UPI0015923FC1|nr:glycosyltransferase [Verrucosispora sp. NA02020]QKW15060.1 glycosyltransferase [Verrucosispora sp. NA02020]
MTDLGSRESRTAPPDAAGAAADWVVYFSATPWHGGAHRQHALARQLATGYRVLFVDPPGLRVRTGTTVRRVEPAVWHAVAPTPVPFGRHLPTANAVNRRVAVAALRRWLRHDPAGVRLVWLDEDLAAPCADRLDAAAVVYDATDLDWTFTRRWNRHHLRRSLDRAVAAADLVLASSAALPTRMPAGRHAPVVLPNACDPEHFAPQGPTVPRPVAASRPLIGYCGAVDTRAFDADLVATVARAHPDWTFLLIGPSTAAGRAPLAGLANVLLTGPIPYADLPATLRACDVTVIPYRIGGLVDYVHPKKCYEYLALGKPVVATPLPALTALTDVVRLAAGPDEFARAIAGALTDATAPDQLARRRAVATANSWAARGEHLHRLLAGLAR